MQTRCVGLANANMWQAAQPWIALQQLIPVLLTNFTISARRAGLPCGAAHSSQLRLDTG